MTQTVCGFQEVLVDVEKRKTFRNEFLFCLQSVQQYEEVFGKEMIAMYESKNKWHTLNSKRSEGTAKKS